MDAALRLHFPASFPHGTGSGKPPSQPCKGFRFCSRIINKIINLFYNH
ncbi:hypothetical protein KNP414_01391 [Paenibacillus mucilaginosus KNP414]|uniref:Uncharacterized protein n=1 Tax=Paenibacillus mucilaginosus (strain KNP414) TaxID=1036673 RepID=F8FL36_PAEMK|nr:hypothetical protein KNP414_01391 [Paenibacillus mucilaginosus KNP414]